MPTLKTTQVLLFGAVLTVGLIVALFPFFPRQLGIDEGNIAKRDLVSPRDETFESLVLTEQARDLAALAVPDVLVSDPDVASSQLAALDVSTATIANVREDESLDEAEKRQALLALVSRDSTDTIFGLSDERWQRVAVEAGQVLGIVLESSIAPGGEEEAQDGLGQLLSPDIDGDEENVVIDLVRPLVVPTLVVDEDATNVAREAAR